MDTSKILKKILQDICSKNYSSTITALPQRPRALATDALNSEEITHLAKHIIKITLWPDISYKKGWLKEIKASLNNLAFKLCKSSVRKNEMRIIQELWYTPKDIINKLNDTLDDAYWKVIDEMRPTLDKISFDPFGTGTPLNFSEVGYAIKQEKTEGGITLTLWLKEQKIS